MKLRLRATGLALFVAGALMTPAQAGSWTYELDKQDHSTLTYSEDGKVTFFLGCGHAFALHVKYPGVAKKDGDATIIIASGKARMTLKGEFEEPDEELATTFQQFDLGYRRQDPDLYRKEWERLRDRLLDLLDSGRKLTISAGKDNYSLPPIEAKGWRKALGKCG
jgi:hypothetical protein